MLNFVSISLLAALASSATVEAISPVSSAAFVYPTTTGAYRYATPVPAPTKTATYASVKYAQVTGAVYTTFAPIGSSYLNDSANPYGNSALHAQWSNYTVKHANVTTTMSPTAISTAELVFPTPDYNIPAGQARNLKFPKGFKVGAGSSAFQIEGAVKMKEGVSPTWTGTLRSDLTRDIARLAAIGISSYAFSISWSRILPFAVPGSPINQQGIDHYNDVINECLKYGIEPVVTMQHFDLPLVFSAADQLAAGNYLSYDFPGWDNTTIVDAFVNYARILFTHYADRVPVWISINEPNDEAGSFEGIRNILLSHGKVSNMYRTEFNGTGKFSIKNSIKFGIPFNSSDVDDIKATNRFNDYQLGFFSSAIYNGVPYPPVLMETFGDLLPEITDDEMKLIYGSSDFNSINVYYGSYIKAPPAGTDACARNSSDASWPTCYVQSEVGIDGWMAGQPGGGGGYNTPQFFRTAIQYVDQMYHCPGGYQIGEIGISQAGDLTSTKDIARYDVIRSEYFRDYAQVIHDAIYIDGINMIGVMAWSFIDDWEFGGAPYGLQWVDYASATLDRYYKKSIFTFVSLFGNQE